MKGRNKKRALVAVLSIFALSASGAALASGCDKTVGRIDAPERIEAELGTYVIPDYEVIDDDGMILAGYNVYLKSATDADGQPVDITFGAVTVEQAGLYKFVYSADSKKVKDVSVLIDFADRTAPTINYKDDLPKFFIKGNSYKMPSYTLSGDYDRSKCWSKVVHIAEDKTETEVEITSNRFAVTENGTYEIRIHVEDAVGNFNDYSYSRKVDGPQNLVKDKVLYFDEAFGERQVSCYENSYTAEFVTGNEVENNVGRYFENGALKVTFDGVTPTRYNEGVIIMDVPAVIDISKYTMLEMWVYNDSDADIIMGSQWWNDTTVKKGKWNRLTWSVKNWGGENGNRNAANTKEIGVVDITGTTIRFVFDYEQKIIPNGTFYFSSMRAIPGIPSTVTAGENVSLDVNYALIGDTVRCSAPEIDGMEVDCFFVDGKPIAGDTFTVTETAHHVTVQYVSKLTYDNMTWGEGFFYPVNDENWMTENKISAQFIGSSDKWVLSADVLMSYFSGTGGQNGNFTFMIGDRESVEIQLQENGGAIKWYFDGATYNTPIATLSDETFNKLKSAKPDSPVNVQVMRNGDNLLFFIGGEFVGKCEIKNRMTNNSFGFGYRKESDTQPQMVILDNVKAIVGEERLELYYARLTSEIDCADGNVSVDKESYRIGDTVTLSHKDPENGKLFGYYTVDGTKIIGDSFVASKSAHTVAAVYVNSVTVTYGDGVSADENDVLGIGFNLHLSHGEAPEAGKVFDHYLVDGTVKVYGNVFTITANSHNITAVWTDAEDMTWGDSDEKYDYAAIMGNESAEWNKLGLDGEVYGSSEYWAITVDVKHTREWNSFEFIQGSKQSIRIRFHQGNYFGVILLVDGAETTPADTQFVHAYPHQNAEVVAKLLEGATVTCVRYGDKITLYADDVPFFTTDYEVDHTGNWFGIGYIADATAATKPEMNNIKFIMGKDKVDAYINATWEDVTVNAGGSVILDKQSYKQYDTVILTAKEAEEGKKFAYFTLNGEKIEGNKFTLNEIITYNFDAVYTDVSILELADGIKTEDGNTEYAMGMEVKLIFDGKIPEGTFFECFTVDRQPIIGDTFITSEKKHVIGVKYSSSKLMLVNGITTADGQTLYAKGVTVTLKYNGTVPANKFFDCFKVDGTPISGNTFITSKDNHVVEVAFASSKDDMTWAEAEFRQPEGVSEVKVTKLGNAEHWTLSYRLTDLNTADNIFHFGAYVGGTAHLAAFEFASWGQVFTQYGHIYAADNPELMISLNDEIKTMIQSVSAQNPVTVTYVRQGKDFKVYLNNSEKTVLAVTTSLEKFMANKDYTDAFGYGWRNDAGSNPTIDNIKFVIGAEKTAAFLDTYNVTLEKTDVTTKEDNYRLGDTVTLIAAPSTEGLVFAYFEVDDKKIDGNTFVATKLTHKVVAKYNEIATLTLAEGIQTADGRTGTITVPRDVAVYFKLKDNTKYYTAFSVNDEAITGNSFIPTEGTTYNVTVTTENRIQNENSKINDLSEAAMHSGTATLNYVSETVYNGADGAVIESGVLKITDSGTDVAIKSTLEVGKEDITNFKEVYFYIYAEGDGVKSGTWWCNETPIAAKQWTKVSVYQNPNLNIGGDGKGYNADGVSGSLFGEGKTGTNFIFRIQNTDGQTVYITSLYGVPYAEAKVSVAEASKEYISLSDPANGSKYMEGEEVTLNLVSEPSGKKFTSFTVNGQKIEGDTYTLGTDVVEFGVEFSEISTVTLGTGITAVGQTAQGGKITVGRDISVTLEFNGEVPSGQVFDCFKVDNVKIVGNSFKTSRAEHKVEAVFVSSADDMTWAEAEFRQPEGANEVKVTKLGNAEHWTLSYRLTDLNTADNIFHFGAYVGGTAHLAAFEFASWGQVFTQYGHIYAADNPELMISLNDEIKTMIKSVSAQNPVTVTYVRQGKDFKVYLNNSEKNVLAVTTSLEKFMANKDYTDAFGYGWRNDAGSNPTIDNIRFVTGEGKVGLYLESLRTEIEYNKASATEDKPYYIGDTVELTHEAAALGYGFSHYIVDGKDIEGNSFTVTKLNHSVEAVYVNIEDTYRIDVEKLAGVVKITNGQLTLPQAAIKDGNGDTVTGYTISVSVTDVAGNTYEVSDGKVQIDYKGAIDLTVTYSCGAFEAVTFTFTVQSSDMILEASETGAKTIKANCSTITFDETLKHGDDVGSVKIHVDSDYDNQYYGLLNAFADGYDYVDFYVYTNAASMITGCLWYGDTDLTQNAWTHVRLRIKSSNYSENRWLLRFVKHNSSVAGADFWISSITAHKTNMLNDLSFAHSTGEWTDEKCYDGDDLNVDRSGSLKVTGLGSEAQLTCGMAYHDMVDYDEVYFYVYAESVNSNSMAGTWWCNDTKLVAGEWTKITVYKDSSKNSNNVTPSDNDNKTLFETGKDASKFVFRFMNCEGLTIYVTSLYGGQPQVAEPVTVVSNGATDYSIANSGNDGLEAVINDNFFPDAE